MSIRPKSGCTYLILILTCFFIPQVQAGWLDDLKDTTGAINDAVNTADRIKKQASGTANTDDAKIGDETAAVVAQNQGEAIIVF